MGRFSRSVRAKWDQNKTPQTLSSHGTLVEQPFPKVRSNCWRAYCAILNSFPIDGAVVLQSNELHGPPWSFAPTMAQPVSAVPLLSSGALLQDQAAE